MTPMPEIPYDPDFDRAERDFDTPPEQRIASIPSDSLFTNASPKLTFLFGFVLGLALVSFAGFIILLLI